MSLYKTWFTNAYKSDGEINNSLWQDFIPKEQKVYEYILTNKVTKLEGTVLELSKQFDMSCQYIVGFIDGINDTQTSPINLDELNEDTKVEINIDFEKLYKKMVEYRADHLYNLKQWENIFTKEEMEKLYKMQKSSRTYIRDTKIERNDPCPCGSGKKYKKCCGVN